MGSRSVTWRKPTPAVRATARTSFVFPQPKVARARAISTALLLHPGYGVTSTALLRHPRAYSAPN
eukprot:2889553-Rhodomonas_salina.2